MGYNTKQKEIILDYMRTKAGEHITVNDISRYFASNGEKISVATIYRRMDGLVADGVVKKYMLDGETSAYYEYSSECEHGCEHYHFKCEECGKLIHFECDELSMVAEHLAHEHGFDVNSIKTMFYGRCENCSGISKDKKL